MVVAGTRPEVVKLAPVVRALRSRSDFEVTVVSTGQHREMLDQALVDSGVDADIDLRVMSESQSLSELTARVLEQVVPVAERIDPAVVVVQGDTTSAFASSLGSFYAGIPVAHVEAGLRTREVRNPFPEELNRRLISRLAAVHFCPTQSAADALLFEGVTPDDVVVTGNTVVDELQWVIAQGKGRPSFSGEQVKILVTLHRRETQGAAMAGIASAIAELGGRGDVEIVLPLHLSPAVRDVLVPGLRDNPGVRLVEPLNHHDFTRALSDCDLVMTDSGGVQEEAPSFAKPVIVLRELTERTEGVDAGVAVVVGTERGAILDAVRRLMETPRLQGRHMANPYGDGKAAERIVAELEARFAPSGAVLV